MSPLKVTHSNNRVFALQASLASFFMLSFLPAFTHRRLQEIARVRPFNLPPTIAFITASQLSSPLTLEQLKISSWGVEHNTRWREEESSLRKTLT